MYRGLCICFVHCALNLVSLLNNFLWVISHKTISHETFPMRQFPMRQFPMRQFPMRQFPMSQFPMRQFPMRQFPKCQLPYGSADCNKGRALLLRWVRRPSAEARICQGNLLLVNLHIWEDASWENAIGKVPNILNCKLMYVHFMLCVQNYQKYEKFCLRFIVIKFVYKFTLRNI